MAEITIYHNPRCSKSRASLALLQENGISPEIVLYLETPPSQVGLEGLLHKLGMSARELMRKGEDVYADKGLSNESLTEAQLIAAMVAHVLEDLRVEPMTLADRGVNVLERLDQLAIAAPAIWNELAADLNDSTALLLGL